jgi:hypothetical protein
MMVLKTPASNTLIVAQHALHADPNARTVGQKHVSSMQLLDAASIGPHSEEQRVRAIASEVGAVESTGNIEIQPDTKSPISLACVTLNEAKQELHAGPSATATGQKQASTFEQVWRAD